MQLFSGLSCICLKRKCFLGKIRKGGFRENLRISIPNFWGKKKREKKIFLHCKFSFLAETFFCNKYLKKNIIKENLQLLGKKNDTSREKKIEKKMKLTLLPRLHRQSETLQH